MGGVSVMVGVGDECLKVLESELESEVALVTSTQEVWGKKA